MTQADRYRLCRIDCAHALPPTHFYVRDGMGMISKDFERAFNALVPSVPLPSRCVLYILRDTSRHGCTVIWWLGRNGCMNAL
jgi:hypothetical protein